MIGSKSYVNVSWTLGLVRLTTVVIPSCCLLSDVSVPPAPLSSLWKEVHFSCVRLIFPTMGISSPSQDTTNCLTPLGLMKMQIKICGLLNLHFETKMGCVCKNALKKEKCYNPPPQVLLLEHVFLPFATAWMELGTIMLNEISQSVKDKYHMSSLP